MSRSLEKLAQVHELEASLPWRILNSFISLMATYDNWLGLFSALNPTYFRQPHNGITTEQKVPSTYALYKLEKIIPKFLEEAERFVRLSFEAPIHYFPTLEESVHLNVFVAFLYHTVLEASQNIDPLLSSKYMHLLKQLDIPQGITNPTFIMSDYRFFHNVLQSMQCANDGSKCK